MTMVDVDIDKYRERLSKRTVRRDVTISEYLNEAANKDGINVSKVLTNTLLKNLKMV